MTASRPVQTQPVENGGVTAAGVFSASDHAEVLACLLDHADRIDQAVADLASTAATMASGDVALQSAIDLVEASAGTARTALQTSLDSEIQNRINGDSTEATARSAAVANLQTQIDSLNTLIGTVFDSSDPALDQFSEIVARFNTVIASIDGLAIGSIDGLQAALDANSQAITDEVTARTQALTAEQTARSAADTHLQSNIDANAANIASGDAALQTTLAAEVQDRIDGDSAEASARAVAISQAVATETAARTQALTAEQTARSAADTQLQSNIDSNTADIASRDAALQTALAAEVQDRIDGDNAVVDGRSNGFPYHGRFLDFDGDLLDGDSWWGGSSDTSAQFKTDQLSAAGLAGYNGFGISTPTEQDRWYHDSATFGGAQPTISAEMLALYGDMVTIFNSVNTEKQVTVSSDDHRFLPGFAVARFVHGTGQLSTSAGSHYRAFTSTNLHKRIGITGKITVAAWIRPVAKSAKILVSANLPVGLTYINGTVTIDENVIELAADTVAHVCMTYDGSYTLPGYKAVAFNMLIENGEALDMWLPIALPGATQVTPHLLPWRSTDPLNS